MDNVHKNVFIFLCTFFSKQREIRYDNYNRAEEMEYFRSHTDARQGPFDIGIYK